VPEGDILRRVAARLGQAMVDREVIYCLLRWPTLGGVDLAGRTITGIEAYGKHVMMHFDDGFTFRSHLRMDGSWRIERAVSGRPNPTGRAKSWQARAVIGNQDWVAIGWRLGMADLLRTRDVDRLLKPLGPDVMASDFDPTQAAKRLSSQGQRWIGAALLDQSLVAGIGTIYMAESLFKWQVRPNRPANQVEDLAGLLSYAGRILNRSVAAVSPTATGQTRAGWITMVHGREHLPCRLCGTGIEVMMVGSAPFDRPAFYCPTCQER